jgi:hypothetical protein
MQFEMIARNDGAIEYHVVVWGATDANDGLAIERPAFEWNGLVRMKQG